MTDTISSLPGGRSCAAVMTGEILVQEVDSRIGRPTAGVPLTRRLCMLEEWPCHGHVCRRWTDRFGCPPHARGFRRSWQPNSSCRPASLGAGSVSGRATWRRPSPRLSRGPRRNGLDTERRAPTRGLPSHAEVDPRPITTGLPARTQLQAHLETRGGGVPLKRTQLGTFTL